MTDINSPKELSREDTRQELWHYMQDNPTTYGALSKKIGIGPDALVRLLDPESKRKIGMQVLLSARLFLRKAYAQRDAGIKGE